MSNGKFIDDEQARVDAIAARLRDGKAADEIPQFNRYTNRVVYQIGQQELPEIVGTIDTYVTPQTVELLQEVDAVGREIIAKHGMGSDQDIFVLFGADFGDGKPGVAYRGPITDYWMTVDSVAPDGERMSWDCLKEIKRTLKRDYNIGAFVFDVTTKPPATTCWE
tara:strand:+ start:80 stop:574 length:495 start_codon:yes stop_codon:yes gene_type:complete